MRGCRRAHRQSGFGFHDGAVLHPAEITDYLYFVARADGSGGHNFRRDPGGAGR